MRKNYDAVDLVGFLARGNSLLFSLDATYDCLKRESGLRSRILVPSRGIELTSLLVRDRKMNSPYPFAIVRLEPRLTVGTSAGTF